MGPCEPGQVGNEAAISSSFQVRWASHRGPASTLVVPASAGYQDQFPPKGGTVNTVFRLKAGLRTVDSA